MKWQDSTKVIITQKLHRIRNWEFQNMLNGMCTIEMIENLKIENSTKMWVCAISPYERRYDRETLQCTQNTKSYSFVPVFGLFLVAGLKPSQIHWASKDTYHFNKATLNAAKWMIFRHRLATDTYFYFKHIWRKKKVKFAWVKKEKNAVKSQEVILIPPGSSLQRQTAEKPEQQLHVHNLPLKLNE